MTQDEIIRMAREAGFNESGCAGIIGVEDFLERFFNIAFAAGAAAERNRHAWTQEHWTQYEHAIAAAEREACAKVCKDIANSQFESGETETAGVLDHCAAAIRARGEKNV